MVRVAQRGERARLAWCEAQRALVNPNPLRTLTTHLQVVRVAQCGEGARLARREAQRALVRHSAAAEAACPPGGP